MPTVLPPPALLPATERRRTGRVVKLALADRVGGGRTRAAPTPRSCAACSHPPAETGTTAMRSARRSRSRRRARSRRPASANSVHNAAAGYWSIATGAMLASTVLCAFDAQLLRGPAGGARAGLRGSGAGIAGRLRHGLSRRPCMPSGRVPDAFGIGTGAGPEPRRPARSARLEATLDAGSADAMQDSRLEALAPLASRPRARCRCSDSSRSATRRTVVLEYLDVHRVSPWTSSRAL